MDKDCYEYICRSYMLLSGIPSYLYKGRTLLSRNEPHPADFDLTVPVIDELLSIKRSAGVTFSKELLMFGTIRARSTDYTIIIGPACSAPITNNVAKEIAISSNISLNMTDSIMHYLNSGASLSIESFCLIISLLNACVNGDIIMLNTIMHPDEPNVTDNEISSRILIYMEQLREDKEYGKRFSYEYEKQLVFFVKNGMIDKLYQHFLNNYKDRQGIVAYDALRQYKNRCISMCTIVSRAAIEGGADPATCYQLCDLYCQKVELCKEISHINHQMEAMLHDFCKRVKAPAVMQTDNPIVRRTIQYVNENVHLKIKVADIAKLMRINPGYLSVKFKSITGIPLPDYITRQKIDEAKYLLKFSDKSIVEISGYLSFSSQSYFQNQFKKLTRMTPMEYRNS